MIVLSEGGLVAVGFILGVVSSISWYYFVDMIFDSIKKRREYEDSLSDKEFRKYRMLKRW